MVFLKVFDVIGLLSGLTVAAAIIGAPINQTLAAFAVGWAVGYTISISISRLRSKQSNATLEKKDGAI